MAVRAPERPAELLAPRRPSGRRRPVLLVAVGAALLLFTAGLATGRITAAPPALPASGPPNAGPVESSPTGPELGVPRAFAHSRAGAIAAAGTYASVFGDKRLLDPAVAKATLPSFMTPALAAEQLAAVPDGSSLVDDPTYAQHIQPLGYQAESYSPRRANISVWLVVISEGEASGEQVSWATDRMTLEWRGGDWIVVAIEGTDGPVPTPMSPGEAGDLMNRFEPFALTPREA